MNVKTLKNQFLRDLKASWKKSAILGVLLVIGLSLWIPPMIRAVRGKGQDAKNPSKANTPSSAISTASGSSALSPKSTSANSPNSHSQRDWQSVELMLQNDPLVKPGAIDKLPSNPFQVDRDQFPPQVTFAEPEKNSQNSAKANDDTKRNRSLETLVLKSTIVGKNRRAAYINRSFYVEGANVKHNGETYRLVAVQPRKVTLQQGDRTWELTLATTAPSSAIQLEREQTQ
ncbi:MAG: hypothetical protein Tsb009_09400 [Planctomycetaceae bacterium]